MTTPATQASSAKDRVVRVFVSSTFRDMIEDRNELMAHVWPALRKVCRGRSVEFVEVDLRWGVTEEQAQRKETLRHCLAEIKRCRPYFIGLLGERYGWTPGPEAYSQALLDEEGWLKKQLAQRSVTELEIFHGVLNDPEMAGRAFFYFRNPKYLNSVPANKKSDFAAEDVKNAEKQKQLKESIRRTCAAKNIPLCEDYADPRVLAALVLKDLTAAIDAEFPADQVPDVWSREDRDHEAYAKSRRTSFYVERDAYFNRLDTFARDGADGCGLTVLGESGGGKSALLANWVAHWRNANPSDFVFQHYIGSSAMSAGHLALMRRLMVAILRWCGSDVTPGCLGSEEEKIPAKAEEIVKAFPEYLGRLAFQAKQKGVRAILVLDALNQLEDHERGRLLSWLPYRLAGELRLIVSTLPGDTLNALQPRNWPALTVETLMPEERVRLIARYLAHFSQGLSEARAKKIADVDAAKNPLYLKTLLDDLRVTGNHELLDEQIADYLTATDIPALFGKILVRYEKDYERDRPGLVREVLSLIWAARRGLTEPELLEALKPAGQERLPAALWSPVRCALEDGLVDRDGILNFSHDFLRTAVQQRYVPDQDAEDECRLRLADLFEQQVICARSCDELPWLLWKTESCIRLRTYLLDINRFLLIRKRDEYELLSYWVWLGEERTMGQPYVQEFERWLQDPGREDRRGAAFQLAGFLRVAALYTDAELLYRRALKLAEQSYGLNHPEVATCLCDRALLLQESNRLAEAETLIRRALQIYEQSYGPDHEHVATALGVLTLILKGTNRLAEAGPLYSRALKITEHNYGPNHPDVALRLNNLALFLNITGQSADAEPLYHRALKIDEQNYGLDHPKIVATLNNLAVLFYENNRLIDAEPLYRRALKIDEQSYGPDHPYVALDLNNLAQLLQDTNRLADAEPLMRRALTISEKNYDFDHPDVGRCLYNLARLLEETKRPNEAEPLMRRSLEIHLKFSRSSGHPHPHLDVVFNGYQKLLIARGLSHEQMIASFQQMDPELFAPQSPEESLKAQERILGGEHPDFISSLNNHAYELRKAGQIAKAETFDRQAAATSVKVLGETNPLALHRRNNLVLTLTLLAKVDEAREVLLQNAQTKAPPHENLIPRIPLLQWVVEVLAGRASEATIFLCRLKAHFIREPLPIFDKIGVPWDLAYFIEALQPKLGLENTELLRALVAVLNARSVVPPSPDLPALLAALNAFPAWREAAPQPLD